MRTTEKILTTVISALMICVLNISVFAESRVQNSFSFSVQDCAYTPLVAKFDDTEYATVYCTANNAIKVTICDSNHRPVSKTITIPKDSYARYNIDYSNLAYKGNSYCLKICSDDYYTNVSGYWTP